MPRCYAFLVMMGYWLLHSLIDWNDVEGFRDQHKDELRKYILSGYPLDMKALGLDDDEGGKMLLYKYCEAEDVELPVLQSDPDEIHMMRTLLSDSFPDLRLKPFPQVRGKIEQLLQEVALGSKEKGENLKEINANAGFYNGYTLKVELRPADTKRGAAAEPSSEDDDDDDEDKDKMKNEVAETTIVNYLGGDKRIAMLAPPLPFKPIPGTSKFTLSKPGVPKSITGLAGRCPWSSSSQVFKIGDGEQPAEKDKYDWQLHDDEGYYNG